MSEISSSISPKSNSLVGGRKKEVPNYKILDQIGRGRTSTVYRALHEPRDEIVALKLFRRRFSWRKQRFLEFSERWPRISSFDTKFVCEPLACGQTDEITWISMRFVDGMSIANRIAWAKGRIAGGRICSYLDIENKERKSPSMPRLGVNRELRRAALIQLLRFFERAALGLAAGHRAGEFHGDLRPKNLMIQTDGNPIWMDWGVAPGVQRGDSGTWHRDYGDVRYLAPERVLNLAREGAQTDDIWSLGAMFYEAICLSLPYKAPTVARLHEIFRSNGAPDPRRVDRSIPKPLANFLTRAQSIDPDRRPMTAESFAEEIANLRSRLVRPDSAQNFLTKFLRRR